jgi:hypothetical protein
MPSAQEIVTELAGRVENLLHKRLTGLGGAILRTQLPQTWSFQVDAEEFSFTADKWGKVTLAPGFLPHADVQVVTTLDRLQASLRSGTPGETPPAQQGITFGTTRGRRGYYFVRRQLRI